MKICFFEKIKKSLENREKKEDLFYLLLIFAVLCVLYGPFMHYPFLPLWDDSNFIITNPFLAFTWKNLAGYFSMTFQDLYTPVTMVSLMVDNFFFGKEPLGYHIHNLLLHIFCTGMLYIIFKRFGIRSFLAFAGCMLWALNPQKVESVIWVTERKDVLSGAFAILSFYLFMRNVEKKTLPLFSSLFAVLALLTKPSTVPLPGVMTVFLICAWGRKHSFREYGKLLLLPLLSCGSILVISYIITARNFPGGLETNYLIPIHNIFWYPLTALFPRIHPVYPPLLQKWYCYWDVFVFGPLLAAGLILWGRKVKISWQKLLGWFLIIGGLMVPVLGMLNYTDFDYCDRYNYLVSASVAGFVMLLCERSFRIVAQKKLKDLIRMALLAFCAVFFLLTYFYLPEWESTEKLFARALDDKVPSNVKLYVVGAHSAIVSGNTLLLGRITEKLFRDWKQYPPSTAAMLKPFTTYFALHCCVLDNEYEAALVLYRQAEKWIKRTGYDYLPEMEKQYSLYLYRNMALTAAYHGLKKESLSYLDIYLSLCEKRALKNIGYYTAMALKAQLRNDKKLLYEALENIVRLDPGLTRYKEDLQKLKREENFSRKEK